MNQSADKALKLEFEAFCFSTVESYSTVTLAAPDDIASPNRDFIYFQAFLSSLDNPTHTQ